VERSKKKVTLPLFLCVVHVVVEQRPAVLEEMLSETL
jgi:hypothetical protein